MKRPVYQNSRDLDARYAKHRKPNGKNRNKKKRLKGLLIVLSVFGVFGLSYNMGYLNLGSSTKPDVDLNVTQTEKPTKTKPIQAYVVNIAKQSFETLWQCTEFLSQTYMQLKQSFRDVRQQRHLNWQKKAQPLLEEFAQGEHLSKVVVSQSLIGQTLLEKHILQAFATLKLKSFYEINRNGLILHSSNKASLGSFPILSGDWSEKRNHELVELDRKLIDQGLALLKILKKQDAIYLSISQLHYSKKYGWQLFMQEPNYIVNLGKSHLHQRSRRLLSVLQKYAYALNSIASIDFDFSSMAIIRVRKENKQERNRAHVSS